MRALIIPDVHLKPWMFHEASDIMKTHGCDTAVCLGDIADDWGEQADLGLYEETYDTAIQFAKDYPNTLWCYGNHDLSYEFQEWETGFSVMALPVVHDKLSQLRRTIPNPEQLAVVHRIDNMLFSHAGITDEFVHNNLSSKARRSITTMVQETNMMGKIGLWQNNSPIWVRPQISTTTHMYKPNICFQVVGHTPVKHIMQHNNLLSCDVFSTYSDKTPIGTEEFVIIDTITWKYETVSGHRC